MGDEQLPALVVVLPADVPEAPPPPAVAAAVAEENPPGTAVVAPQAEVNFSPVICCLLGSATLPVSLVLPSPFLGNFSVVDEFATPCVLFLDYRLWSMWFYLARSVVAECLFPVPLCFLASFLLLGCGRERNNLFCSVVAGMGIIFVDCGRDRIHFCRLWPRWKRFLAEGFYYKCSV